MASVITSNHLGLLGSSANVLGGNGQLGSAVTGLGGDGAYVNAATGNLTVQRQDEILLGLGPDIGVVRTYNSQGSFDFDANVDNWQLSLYRRVFDLTGTVNTTGSTIKRTASDGSELTYTYDDETNSATYGKYVTKDGAGSFDTLTYNSTDDVWTWEDGDSRVTETYEAQDATTYHIKTVSDTDGNALSYTYNANNLITAVQSANGGRTELIYDPSNRLTQINVLHLDESSNLVTTTRVSYGYDGNNRLQTVTTDLTPDDGVITDGNTYVTTYGYDANGRITSIGNSDGTGTNFGYDGTGRIQTVTDGANNVTTYNYVDATTTTISVTDNNGQTRVTTLTYDTNKQLTRVQGPVGSGQDVSYSYDVDGNVISMTDSRGNTTNYQNDANGNRIRQEDHLGNTVTWTYDDNNQVTTETTYRQADTNPGDSVYDAASAQTIRYAYDNASHLRFIISAEGRVTEYRYAADGTRTSSINYTDNLYTTAGAIDDAIMEAWVDAASAPAPAPAPAPGPSPTPSPSPSSGSSVLYSEDFNGTSANINIGPTNNLNIVDAGTASGRISIGYAPVASNNWPGFSGANNTTYTAGHILSAEISLGVDSTATDFTFGLDGSDAANVGTYFRIQLNGGYVNASYYDSVTGWTGSWSGGTTGSSVLESNTTYIVEFDLAQTSTTAYLYKQGETRADGWSYTAQHSVAWSTYHFGGNVTETPNGQGLSNDSIDNIQIIDTTTGGSSNTSPTVTLAALNPTYTAGEAITLTATAADSDGTVASVAFYDGSTLLSTVTTEPYTFTVTNAAVGNHAYTAVATDNDGATTVSAIAAVTVNAVSGPSGGIDKTTTQRTDYTYDVRGQLNSTVTYGTIDAAGNGVSDSNTSIVQYIYDQYGNLTQTIDARGVATTGIADDYITSYGYDGLHRIINQEDAEGNITTTVYDDTNRQVRTTLANNLVTTSTYDLAGRLISVSNGQSGALSSLGETQYLYDDLGQLRRATDATGQHTYYLYDDLGRQVGVIDPNNNLTETVYNDNGQVSKVIQYTSPVTATLDAATALTVTIDDVRALTSGTPTNTSPTVTLSPLNATYTEGDAITLTATAADSDGTVASIAFYDGSTLLSTVTTEPYTYTVTNAAVGSHTYTAVATDNDGATTVSSIASVTVNAASGSGSTPSIVYSEDFNGASANINIGPTNNLNIVDAGTASGRISIGYAPVASNNWPGFSGADNTTYTAGHVLSAEISLGVDSTATDFTFGLDGSDAANVGTYFRIQLNGGYVNASYYDSVTGWTGSWSGGTTGSNVLESNTTYIVEFDLAQTSTTAYLYKQGETRADGWSYTAQHSVAWSTYHFGGNVTETPNGQGLSNDSIDNIQIIDTTVAGTPAPAPAPGPSPTPSPSPAPSSASITSPADRISYNVYDDAGRLVKQINAVGSVTSYQYDGANQLIGTVSYANLLTNVQMSALAAQTGEIAADDVNTIPVADSAQDRTTRSLYSADGLLLATLDSAGYLTEHLYDAAGQRIQSIVYATATAIAQRATADLATLRPTTDAVNDQNTYFIYDNKGQLSATVDPQGYLTEYQYDLDGNRTNTTRYATAVNYTLGASLDAIRPAVNVEDQTITNSYDQNNRLQSSQSQPDGLNTSYTYDEVGNLTATVNSFTGATTAQERGQRQQYDQLGRVTRSLSGEGVLALTTLEASGTPTQTQIDNIWNSYGTRYSYDQAGRVVVATTPNSQNSNGNKTYYYYDSEGKLIYEINPLGEVIEYGYNSFDERETSQQYKTRLDSATLDTLNGGFASDIQAQINALAADGTIIAATTQYDNAGRIISVTDALNDTTSRTYNAFGEIATTTTEIDDNNSVTTRYAYDQRGLVQTTTEDDGGLNRITQVEYDAFGRIIQTTDGEGGVMQYQYDRLGREVQVTDARNITRGTTYDAFSRVLTRTDGRNNTTTYSYDTANRTSTMTTAEGISITTEKNRYGETVKVTDGNDNVTTYTYNADGQLKTTTTDSGTTEQAATSTSTNDYDSAGQLIKTTDARGVETHFTYDAANRLLTQTVDPTSANPSGLNLETEYRYDALGRHHWLKDANGIWTRTDYNDKGQVLAVVVDPSSIPDSNGIPVTNPGQDGAAPLNLTTSYTYDGRGKRLTVTEGTGSANPKTTQYVYDKLGRLSQSVIDPGTGELNITTSYQYDDNDNVLIKTDANGHQTVYRYDANNRLTHTIDPLGYVSVNQYDDNGNLTNVTHYATALSAADLNALQANPQTAAINVTTNASQDQTTTNAYDQDNRLDSTTNAQGIVTRYTYDNNGNQTQVIENAGNPDINEWRTTTQTFDAANRKIAATDPTGNTTSTTYDAAGNITSVIDPLGNIGYFYYDAAGRMTHSINPEGAVTEQQFDALGNITETIRYANTVGGATVGTLPAIVVDSTQDQRQVISYDAASRQTTIQTYWGAGANDYYTESMTYDGQGNILTQVARNGAQTTYTYDAAGRKATETLPITSKDASNNDVAVVNTFAYDGMGNLTTKTEAAGLPEARTTTYTYTLNNLIASESMQVYRSAAEPNVTATKGMTYDARGNVTSETDANGNVSYYYYDSLDRMAAMVDANGVMTSYQYDAVGNKTSQTVYATPVANPTTGTQPTPTADPANDRTMTYVYDKMGREISNQVDNITYGSVTDENTAAYSVSTGSIVNSTQYNALGNVIKQTDANGNVVRTYYNSAGESVATVDADNYLTIWTRDAFGNIARETRYANQLTLNITDTTTLDDIRAGLVVSTDDRTTLLSYDKLNRVTAENIKAVAQGEINAINGVLTPDVGTTSVVTGTLDTANLSVNGLSDIDSVGMSTGNIAYSQTYYAGVKQTPVLNGILTGGQPRTHTVNITLPYNELLALGGGDAIIELVATIYTPAKPSANIIIQPPRPESTETVTRSFLLTNGKRSVSTVYDLGFPDAQINQYAATDYTKQLTALTVKVTKSTDNGGVVVYQAPVQVGKTNISKQYAVDKKLYIKETPADTDQVVMYYRIKDSGDAFTTVTLPQVLDAAGNPVVGMYAFDYGSLPQAEYEFYYQALDVNSNVLHEHGVMDVIDGHMTTFEGDAVTQYTYDGLNNITQKTDATNVVSNWTYDGLGRQTSQINPAYIDFEGDIVRPTTDYEYNGLNQAVREIMRGKDNTTEADDHVKTYDYSVGGRLTSETDATGAVKEYQYDANGNITQTKLNNRIDADGNLVDDTVAYGYDALNRQLTTHDLGTGLITEVQYNSFNQMSAKRSYEGAAPANWDEYIEYDQAGRIWKTNAGDGVNKVLVNDANGNATLSVTGTIDLRNMSLSQVLNQQALDQANGVNNQTFYTMNVYDSRNQQVTSIEPEMIDNLINITDAGDVVMTTGNIAYSQTYAAGSVGNQYSPGVSRKHTVSLTLPSNEQAGLGIGSATVQLIATIYTPAKPSTDQYTPARPESTQVVTRSFLVATGQSSVSSVFDLGIPDFYGGTNYTPDVDYTKRLTALTVKVTKFTDQGDVVVFNAPVQVGKTNISQQHALTKNLYIKGQPIDTTSVKLHYRVKDSSDAYTVVDVPQVVNNVGTALLGTYAFNYASLSAADYEFYYQALDVNNNVLNEQQGEFSTSTPSASQFVTPPDESSANKVTILRRQSYNAFGEVIKETDGNGNETSFTYNTMGKLTLKTDPTVSITTETGQVQQVNPTTEYTYDAVGRVIGYKDANGNLHMQAWMAGAPEGAEDMLTFEQHADGGTKTYLFDVYGNKRQETNEVGQDSQFEYDAMGRLTQTTGYVGNHQYAYDQLGQRISHLRATDDTFSGGDTEKTFYDSLGRVSQTRSYMGFATNYDYEYQNTIASLNGNTGAGWRKTTVRTDGKTLVDYMDMFNRVTRHVDMSGRDYTYNYNAAGWLTSQTSSVGQDIVYEHYDNGYLRAIHDRALGVYTYYEYDDNGNKTYEAYTTLKDPVDVNQGFANYYQQTHISYDALNRIHTIKDPKAIISYTYDAVGNRRSMSSTYYQVNGTQGQQTYWYAYDSMNRFTTTMGALVNGEIVLGNDGVNIEYNTIGQRVKVINGNANPNNITTEVYGYSNEGYLDTVKINGVLRSYRENDVFGRVWRMTEYNASGGISYRVTNTYDADNRVTRQVNNQSGAITDYYYYNADGTASVNGAGQLRRTRTDPNGAASGGTITNTYYAYEYWDEAKVTAITANAYNPDIEENNAVWASGYSDIRFDVNGHTTSAIDRHGNRNIQYVTDSQGRILLREEITGIIPRPRYRYYGETYNPGAVSDKVNRYIYVDGRQVGEVSNTGPSRVDYVQSMAARNNRPANYKGWRPVTSADFDQSYEPISPTYPGPVAGTYTVRNGDTLQSIAQTLWGDSSLWYILADANGLTSLDDLVEGVVLTVPNKVTNVHNNAGTFRPYNPGEAIGDVSPTVPAMPKPPKKSGGCGGIGTIVAVVVAVVATVLTAGALAPVTASIHTGIAGIAAGTSIGVGAVAGAVGAIAGQIAGIALGVQDGFNWGAVATGAIGGAIGSAIGNSGIGNRLGEFGKAAARAVVGNVANQAVGNVLGTQKGFSWASVAAAGVGAYTSASVGDKLGIKSIGEPTGFAANNPITASVATSLASSAASELTRVAIDGGRINWSGIANGVAQTAARGLTQKVMSQRATVGNENRDTGRSVFEANQRYAAANSQQYSGMFNVAGGVSFRAPTINDYGVQQGGWNISHTASPQQINVANGGLNASYSSAATEGVEYSTSQSWPRDRVAVRAVVKNVGNTSAQRFNVPDLDYIGLSSSRSGLNFSVNIIRQYTKAGNPLPLISSISGYDEFGVLSNGYTHGISNARTVSLNGLPKNHFTVPMDISKTGYDIYALVNNDTKVPLFYTAYNSFHGQTEYYIGQDSLGDFLNTSASHRVMADLYNAPDYIQESNLLNFKDAYISAAKDPEFWLQVTSSVTGGLAARGRTVVPNSASSATRARIESNIAKSQAARESSNFDGFIKAEGKIQEDFQLWPPNRGQLGPVTTVELQPGTFIDRYGSPRGSFVAPQGTSFAERALPSYYEDSVPFFQYEVVKPIPNAVQSKVLPWFGQKGLGTQFELNKPVQWYLDEGYLK